MFGLLEARAQQVFIPGFWDPNNQIERPQLTGQGTVHFLTDSSFPPLHFNGIDNNLTGFSVELARAACEKLGLTCTIQSRRFVNLLDTLKSGQGDAIAAAIPITGDLRQSFAVTGPYFKNPARFVQKLKQDTFDNKTLIKKLAGKRIAVVSSTTHEAFLQRYIPAADLKSFPDIAQAEQALKEGTTDYIFADGISLALWLNGTASSNCCTFVGGPFLESKYFGEGIGFIFRQEDSSLQRAFDYALYQLWKEGKYAELYLRFFPVSPY
ncbi:transporter substrate-binding domain-containing protein [Microvirga sp. W0021]|uniref:Transporter substrate-binding domain-containing protein n=1 Tax=Hohaiivirga grylli TaxID=3133970 RepID=A0ABV0BHW8_9HYPH